MIALVKLLRELGETPVVLSRGYGGKLAGRCASIRAAQRRPMSAMSRCCWRAACRSWCRATACGVALAVARRASVIVMDDGFQNPPLRKDVSLIVIDSNRGIGNGRCFPRARCARRWLCRSTRTDVLIVTGDGSAADDVAAA